MKDTLTILKDAYQIIRNKNNWTSKVAARDANGMFVHPWEDEAVQWCAAGAIWKASGTAVDHSDWHIVSEPFNLLVKALGDNTIAYVNDGPDGYERVCAAYRKAIADLTPVEQKQPEADDLILA